MTPVAAQLKSPVVAAAKEPLVEYVRRSLELEEPDEIERRADELTGIGYAKTADHLRERADALRAGWRGRPARASRDAHPSPIPEASDEQWTRFVQLMQTGELATVTPGGQFGLFQTRLKRLEDVGLAREVRRVEKEGRATWTAAFRRPLTMERLLADPVLQYRIFAASMKRYRNDILGHVRSALGRDVEGKRATLSGLLAVAHYAGPALGSWLTNEKDRRRFEKTTTAYGRTTGVF
jgi:hypothetical protein